MTLDELENQLPWGLHDAELARLEVDWASRRLTLEVRCQLGERQEASRLARVTLEGLQFFVALPPTGAPPPGRPSINAGAGRIPGDHTPLPAVPEGSFLHHLYTYDSWQYLYVCAQSAALIWLEPEPVPSPTGPRALLPGDEIPDP